jgi:cysteine-rich repeat protein
VTSDESCDDGNTVGSDGCSADCLAIEPGWQCRVPGKSCSPVCAGGQAVGSTCVSAELDAGAVCGDGIVGPGEECDDGSDPKAPLRNDDARYGGCSTTCKLGPYCGDGMVNGAEACDLGAQNGGGYGSGGCTSACTTAHFCGDGFVDGDRGEDCDLGPSNGVTGFPCDKTCRQNQLEW